MTYYIDGKQVRKSERTYTHAVLHRGQAVSCSGSYDLAVKEMARRLKQLDGYIEERKMAIKAIDAGKTYYIIRAKNKHGSYVEKIKIRYTRDEYLAQIAKYEEEKTHYSIRALEIK